MQFSRIKELAGSLIRPLSKLGKKTVGKPVKKYINNLMEKDMTTILISVATVGVAIVIGLGSGYFFGDDNPVEEIAEKVIEWKSGFDVDLSLSTPETKEKK